MSAYFAPLVCLPNVITTPGDYITRSGETVTITRASMTNDYNCLGRYPNGVAERWHRSGRILATRETQNDIVRPA